MLIRTATAAASTGQRAAVTRSPAMSPGGRRDRLRLRWSPPWRCWPGAIASVSGFGIGSLLTPTLALQIDPRLAVAAVSIPHVVGTAIRFWMLRQHVDTGVLVRFGATSALGSLAGAVAGAFVRPGGLAAAARGPAALRRRRRAAGVDPADALRRPLGLGGRRRLWSVRRPGRQPGRAAGGRDARLPPAEGRRLWPPPPPSPWSWTPPGCRSTRGPTAPGWSRIAPLIALATAGVVLGTLVGHRVLAAVPERLFRVVVALLLLALGVVVIVAPERLAASGWDCG